MSIFGRSKADYSVVSGGFWPKSNSFKHVLDSRKNVKYSIKNEGARVANNISSIIRLGIFRDTQWQITPRSRIRSDRILNSFEALCLSSLPARKKEIRSKMKPLEWPQHFPHYSPMGAICCHGNQSSDPIWPKPNATFPPNPIDVSDKIWL